MVTDDIVGSGATGDWAGWDLNVALWTDGAWLRLPPRTGWRAWLEDEGLLLVYDGAAWIRNDTHGATEHGAAGARNHRRCCQSVLGQTQRRALEARGRGGTGDSFYTMNKEAPGDDLGLTLQTGFVTKALVGLFGSDSLRLAGSGRRQHLLRRAERRQRHRHRRSAPAAAVQGVHQLRQLRRSWQPDEIGLNNTDTNDQGAFDA